jgi:selenocysteine lyase/cysteine desulfurase
VTQSEFRAQFPVLSRVAFLNAGTSGPVPSAAVQAVRERLDAEASLGRSGKPYQAGLFELAARLREAYARVLGCSESDVALTGSTTDGVNTVLSGMSLGPGDEIVTSDEEHPGLLGPLGLARRRYGVSVRVVPFASLAEAVGPATRLVACSHVSWVSGRVADVDALRSCGVPLLYDGAQGLGAVPVSVDELGCDFYAASGQKWLCGPEGSGCLYVRAERLEELTIPWPGYGSLSDPSLALELSPAAGARRFDHGFPVGLRNAFALASLEVLSSAGWDWVHERAAERAAATASALAERGFDVWPRGRSTLVSIKVPDAAAVVERLAGAGVVVRSIPEHGLVRMAVGAWNADEDIERLLDALGPA